MTRRHSSLNEVTAKVARALRVPVKQVREITKEFFYQSAEYLAENHVLMLEGLGVLRLHVEHLTSKRVKRLGKRTRRHRSLRVAYRTRVYFTKSQRLKELALRHAEEDMDKYGVDESKNSEQLEKQAAQGCPECGSPVKKHGAVLICPVHGSAPFEEKRDSGERK